MSIKPRIAIVGGGPAGLTLGLLLHKKNIPFTLYELRQKPAAEDLSRPSGMLDLHEDTGLAVIKACGLHKKFLPLTGECTENFIVAERNGKILFTSEGENTRPEISRNNLTKLLLGNLPAENVKWGRKLFSASQTTNAQHETVLNFGAHGKHTYDLVVGADGAWSKVRHLLTDNKPRYTGMHIITLTIQEVTRKYPHLAQLVGSGSFSSLGNKHAVISQRGANDSARIYLWFTVPDENFATSSGFTGKPASSAKYKLLEDDALYGTFGPLVKELIATACDEEAADNPGAGLDIRRLYALPHGSSYKHNAGVTLVGDAAHLMLPNGEGVNFAMFDSFLLSQAIVAAHNTAGGDIASFQKNLDPLLQDFEANVVERAKKVGEETDGMMGKMFGTDDAAYEFLRFFKEMTQEQPQN
ncbi:Monooxygenase asqM [Paramyrothecium foliicola]|nr:Monooxygenase asqM [Paramyrothecium foliicola]